MVYYSSHFIYVLWVNTFRHTEAPKNAEICNKAEDSDSPAHRYK